VEGPDMAAHRCEPHLKRELIERLDRELIGPLWQQGVRLAVTCDHGTSSVSGRHLSTPVPFVVAGAGVDADDGMNGFNVFDDRAASPVWDRVRWQGLLLETPVRC